MKTMKKILAVGALLATGTMVMANSVEQEFEIQLNVIAPLSIESTGTVDFGEINYNDLQNNITASDQFTVTGADDMFVTFDVQSENTVLTNGNQSEDIRFKAETTKAGETGEQREVKLDGGEFVGDMLVTLTDVSNAGLGEYTGAVNLVVDYR